MADTEREAFEAWASNEFPDYFMDKDPVGDYYAEPIDVSWKGWSAALASRPAEVDDEGQTDAKRLDWLESTSQTFCGNYSNTGFRAIGSSIWHGTLREAIDGAMIEAEPSHTTNKEK